MSTWKLVKGLHHEMFRKIQLLEEAYMDLLAKKITYEKGEKLAEDFVKFSRVGVIKHFKVEEVALFQILRRNFKDVEPIIYELISEHKTTINKYFKLHDTKNPKLNKTEDLIVLLNTLTKHMKKEERSLPPFIELLSDEQLKKIDALTRRMGYHV